MILIGDKKTLMENAAIATYAKRLCEPQYLWEEPQRQGGIWLHLDMRLVKPEIVDGRMYGWAGIWIKWDYDQEKNDGHSGVYMVRTDSMIIREKPTVETHPESGATMVPVDADETTPKIETDVKQLHETPHTVKEVTSAPAVQ